MKETPVLTDKDIFPTEEIIFSHIGKASALWISVFEYIHSNHPEIEEQWRYYNDGKSWLMKVTKKTKTIFWLSLDKNSFRTTFYFPSRVEETILNSKLPDDLKKQFVDGKSYGKIKGLTILFSKKADVNSLKELIDLKLKIK